MKKLKSGFAVGKLDLAVHWFEIKQNSAQAWLQTCRSDKYDPRFFSDLEDLQDAWTDEYHICPKCQRRLETLAVEQKQLDELFEKGIVII